MFLLVIKGSKVERILDAVQENENQRNAGVNFAKNMYWVLVT